MEYCYLLEERGRERHEGEFGQTYCACETVESAILMFENELKNILNEKDFFLKDELDKGNFEQITTITLTGEKLPCFSVDNGCGEWYELYVCRTDYIKGEKYEI